MSQPRILIVDDNKMMVKTLQDILTMKGFQTEIAYSGPEALQKVEQSTFDCVLSDIKMPDIDGVQLYRILKTRHPDLPVVLMTAYTTDGLVQAGLDEGAIAVLNNPLNMGLLLKFFAHLSRERSIIIVDDDPTFCRTLADILQTQNFAVTQVTEPDDVQEKLADEGQVVLLDMKLKGSNGLDVLRQIRQQHPYLPVILITGYPDEVGEAVQTALKINAYTYFHKPVQIEKLLQTLNEIHHQELGRMLGRAVKKQPPQ